jgi:peroxiredoxin
MRKGEAGIISPVEINQPAPDFSLPDLSGTTHRLGEVRGRIAVVNFWSAECPWVARVDRELVAGLQAWGESLALLTIAANASESDELVAGTARDRRLPLVLRASPEVLEAYAVEVTPQLFVVDAGGLLRYTGAFDDVTFRRRVPTRYYLSEAIAALLSGRLPDPPRTPPYGCTVMRQSPELC